MSSESDESPSSGESSSDESNVGVNAVPGGGNVPGSIGGGVHVGAGGGLGAGAGSGGISSGGGHSIGSVPLNMVMIPGANTLAGHRPEAANRKKREEIPFPLSNSNPSPPSRQRSSHENAMEPKSVREAVDDQ